MKILLLLLISFNALAVTDKDINSAIDANELTKAMELVRQMKQGDVNFKKINYYKARIYFRQNELDKAEDFIEKAIKDYPNAITYNVAGGIYGMQAGQASVFSKLGYTKKSKKYLQKAYEADPTNSGYISGLIQFNIQAPRIAGGDMDAVEPLLKQLEKYNKPQAISLRVQYLIEEEETALAYLDSEITKDPNNFNLVFSKGYLLSTMDEPQKAVIEYQKVINNNTSSTKNIKSRFDALYQLGRLSSMEGKWLNEGRDAFIEFINHEKIEGTPSKSWASYRLGLIYKELKQYELAQSSFTNALSLNPDKELQKRIKKEL